MKQAPKIDDFIKPELSWAQSWGQWFQAWERFYFENKPVQEQKPLPAISTKKINKRSVFLDKFEVFIFSFWVGYFISYLWRTYVRFW